jgi:hypothetical protein
VELEGDLEDMAVDSDRIKAINTMVDEFTNIISKNFAVYG